MSPQQSGRTSNSSALDRVPLENNMYATGLDFAVQILILAAGILTSQPFGLTIAAVTVCS